MTEQWSPAAGGASPIAFRIDYGSGVPTYLQLVQQVEQALRLGYLAPGDQLPRIREVVAALAINPNTVAKAYRELEHRGLAAGRPGQGTFVQGRLETVGLTAQRALRRRLFGWLQAAEVAGLDKDGVTALFSSALFDFYSRGNTASRPTGADADDGSPERPPVGGVA